MGFLDEPQIYWSSCSWEASSAQQAAAVSYQVRAQKAVILPMLYSNLNKSSGLVVIDLILEVRPSAHEDPSTADFGHYPDR